jgi:ankyrin repeat protein
VAVIRLLLERGAHVNADHIYGTALIRSSSNGHVSVVQLLLDNGAIVDADYTHGTALQLAACNGHSRVVELLLKYGARPDYSSFRPTTQPASVSGYRLAEPARHDSKLLDLEASALQLSSENGYQDVVRLLVEKGAKITADSGKGGTPLQRASKNGHVWVVQFLLGKGADPIYALNLPVTAVRLASDHGYKNIVHLLLR